jgi:hypothetical protein
LSIYENFVYNGPVNQYYDPPLDAARNSSPGARDGECDACVTPGGNSTEDEMFILLGAYYVER